MSQTPTTTRRPIDQARFKSILNSRALLSRNLVGQQVILAIQGSPTFLSAAEQEERTPGHSQYFDKRIYNLLANSEEAMGRKENRKLLARALKADSAGHVEEAHELFNEYLNNVQVSFNQIVNSDEGYVLQSGDMVTAIVETAETKDGYNAIVVNRVRYKAPVSASKSKFDITDLIDEDEEIEEPAAPAAPAKQPAKAPKAAKAAK